MNQICPYHWLHMTQKTCWESMSLNVLSLCQPVNQHTRLQNASQCSEVFTAGHLPCSKRICATCVRMHPPVYNFVRDVTRAKSHRMRKRHSDVITLRIRSGVWYVTTRDMAHTIPNCVCTPASGSKSPTVSDLLFSFCCTVFL